MFADRQDLGFPDPGEVEGPGDLTDVVEHPGERAAPPDSPWLWWNPVLSGLQGGPPDHRTD
jgi:hypothetical protein